jgi:CRISPR-associated protein Cas5/CasD subtype I-E
MSAGSRFFTLRLVAPIASLQGSRIDGLADTIPVPSRSMIAGLIGAAIGVGYDEPKQLQQIQDTLRLAIVVHRSGVVEQDYQIVRMGLPHMVGPMWWHDGHDFGVMERAGGDPERSIIVERPLSCDIDMTVVVELLSDAPFTAAEILAAFDEPAYPLGIGQRVCIPTMRIAGVTLEAKSMTDAIAGIESSGTLYVPAEVAEGSPQWGDLYVSVPAGRNWTSRQHGGSDTYVVRNAHLGR